MKTKTARYLGIRSRPEFFMRVGSAFLNKHDPLYAELEKLMDLPDDDVRDTDLPQK